MSLTENLIPRVCFIITRNIKDLYLKIIYHAVQKISHISFDMLVICSALGPTSNVRF